MFPLHAFNANLVQLVERDQRVGVPRLGDPGALEQRRQREAVIQPHDEVLESEAPQHFADGAEQLRPAAPAPGTGSEGPPLEPPAG